MARRKYDFREEDKVKVLLWCARHCCLCGKACGMNIEVAHLDNSKKNSNIDNAVPWCFFCHAEVGRYNRSHPRGKKYAVRELKARRNQVYEQQTSHLVPAVRYVIAQMNRKLPDVGFQINHLGGAYPIKARITVSLYRQGKKYKLETVGHYDGRYVWNLNPGFGVAGHFKLPDEMIETSKVEQNNRDKKICAKVEVTLIDIYEREHVLLPEGFILDLSREPAEQEWYLEPCMEEIETTRSAM